MVIGIDLDEVLFDFVGPFLEFANKKFGTHYTRADMTEYSFEKSGVIPKGTNHKLVHEFGKVGGLKQLPSMPGAVAAVKALMREHEVVFITSRNQEFENDTLTNFQYHGIKNPRVYFSSKEKPKSVFTRKHKVDLFFDDSPKFITDVFLHGGVSTVIMVSTLPNAIAEVERYCTGVAPSLAEAVKTMSVVKQKDPV